MVARHQQVLESIATSDVEVISPENVSKTRVIQIENSPRLVHKPTWEESYGMRSVYGLKDNKAVIPWGFWGGLLIVIVAISLVVFRGTTGLYDFSDILLVLVAVGLGTMMVKLGAKTSLEKLLLCEVDLEHDIMRWDTVAELEMKPLHISLDSITEIVFGMTYFPVSSRRPDVKVHAFTLLVRDDSQRLIPVIEASPNKEEAFHIAIALSQTLGKGITYVGHGIK